MLIVGELASLNRESIMLSHKEFSSSCTLMELDVIGNTPRTDTPYLRKIIGQDGQIYKERRLQIHLEFRTELFMKIEQKKDYSGQSKMWLQVF
jgi:hypothetical protein